MAKLPLACSHLQKKIKQRHCCSVLIISVSSEHCWSYYIGHLHNTDNTSQATLLLCDAQKGPTRSQRRSTAAPLTVTGCLSHSEPHAGQSGVQWAVINKIQAVWSHGWRSGGRRNRQQQWEGGEKQDKHGWMMYEDKKWSHPGRLIFLSERFYICNLVHSYLIHLHRNVEVFPFSCV